MNSVTTTHHYQLAGRSARLGAALLDMLIWFASLIPGVLVFSATESDLGKGIGATLLVVGLLVLFGVQMTYLLRRGQSLGKMIVGIKIVRVSDGATPGFVKIVLLRMVVPNLLYGIPYLGQVFLLVDLLFIFREDRRCIHDLMAETKVVDATAVLAPAIAVPTPRPSFAESASPAFAPTPARAASENTKTSPDTVSKMSSSTASPEAVPSATLQTPQQAAVVTPAAFDENAIYATVANELETGQTDKGLWTRLYVENDGDEKKTKLAYIKQRAEKMITDERARIEEHLRQEREAFEITEAERLKRMGLPDRYLEMKARGELPSQSVYLDFLLAVRRGDCEKAQQALAQNEILLAMPDSEDNTALHRAIFESNERMIETLIRSGSPVDMKNNRGQSPIDLVQDKPRLKKLMIDLGVNV